MVHRSRLLFTSLQTHGHLSTGVTSRILLLSRARRKIKLITSASRSGRIVGEFGEHLLSRFLWLMVPPGLSRGQRLRPRTMRTSRFSSHKPRLMSSILSRFMQIIITFASSHPTPSSLPLRDFKHFFVIQCSSYLNAEILLTGTDWLYIAHSVGFALFAAARRTLNKAAKAG